MQRGVLRTLQGGRVGFFCPGCREMHQLRIEGASPGCWGFNGDYDRPTFTPSVLVRGIRAPNGDVMTEAEEAEYDAIFASGGREAALASRFGSRCHSFVTDGAIRFLDDCTHDLRNQTAALRPFGGEDDQ